MCWACEQERFWAEYAKVIAARQAGNGDPPRPAVAVPLAEEGEAPGAGPAASSPSRSSP